MKSLDELKNSNCTKHRLAYYYITKEWWEALDDKSFYIRLIGHFRMFNPEKSKNDACWIIRLDSYYRYNNWHFARHDKEDIVREIAQYISYPHILELRSMNDEKLR